MEFKELLFKTTRQKYQEYKHSTYVCPISEQEGLFIAYHTMYMLVLKLGLEQEYAQYIIQRRKRKRPPEAATSNGRK